jgi:hypothetical protein
VQVVVILEGEAIHDVEALLGAERFGHGDGSAQLDDRRRGEAGELAVESRDLGPVARLIGMQARDRGLHDVGAPAV